MATRVRWWGILVLTFLFLVTAGGVVGCQRPPSSEKPSAEATPDFPKEPIRIIVSDEPGGPQDVTARTLQPFFAKYVGANVVVENMPGGAEGIGRGYVYRSEPTGYVLLVAGLPNLVVAELMQEKPSYKAKELTPIYNLTGLDAMGVYVRSDSPIKTLADLRTASEKKKLIAAHAGAGTNTHLVLLQLLQKGIQADQVQFSGPETIPPLVTGDIDFGVLRMVTVPKEESRIRCIAISTKERHPAYPDIPTCAEQGFDINLSVEMGVYGPPNLPTDRRAVLEKALKQAVEDPEYQALLKKQGRLVHPLDGKALATLVEEVYNSCEDLVALVKQAQGKGKK